jgi:RNA polymerase sigma-54 factor
LHPSPPATKIPADTHPHTTRLLTLKQLTNQSLMKQSLQLKLSQQLKMTPQLQQAIKLLQLSAIDLQQEIQTALEENPLLDQVHPEEEFGNNPGDDYEAPTEQAKESEVDATEVSWEDKLPDELPIDSQWQDLYEPMQTSSFNASNNAGEDYQTDQAEVNNSLHDQLHWQLNLTPMSDTDRLIATSIIDSIEASGLLGETPEDIHQGLPDELEIEFDEVMAVLHRIQHFEPAGVGAQDLSECLLIQLNQLADNTPWLKEAKTLITRYMLLLGNRDLKGLMRQTRLSEEQLKETLDLIRSLNPRPGDSIKTEETEYIIPDVIVTKVDGIWAVQLNNDISPKLKINSDYSALIKPRENSPQNNYLREHLQEARWLIKSIQSRNDTLLKVSAEIVKNQQAFLEHGDEAMKPLILHNIAEAIEMHESTVSRVTNRKYMLTPIGVYELKYFFSSHVSTDTGEECSSTAIRAIIKRLVSEEESRKPLSDSKITKLLEEQGIQVARRTVAKYRESLNIPASNERKQLY